MPGLDGEEGPEIYVGATKEAQAKHFGNKLLPLSKNRFYYDHWDLETHNAKSDFRTLPCVSFCLVIQ
jgi:hypothetical protein